MSLDDSVTLLPGPQPSNSNKTIKRISAHRQTWFNSGSIDLTPQGRRAFDEQYLQHEIRTESRWKDHNAHQKQSAVFFDLVAKDNAEARSLRSRLRQVDPQNPGRDFRDVIEAARRSVPLFEQLNELLALGTLTVSLENSDGEEILARHGNNGASFSIAQMSDGERNAALIAATVLTVEPGTTLLIDEPELHLHRAIIEPFLSALFEQRTDCAFVVSTHEIALPMAHPSARVLLVRSCEWHGNTAKVWDVAVLDPTEDLPEELKRAILGARRRIVFVEGTSSAVIAKLLVRRRTVWYLAAHESSCRIAADRRAACHIGALGARRHHTAAVGLSQSHRLVGRAWDAK